MSQSFSATYVHLVFSTIERRAIFQNPEFRDRVHRYLCGIAKNLDCPVISIGGTADHVHLLVHLGKSMAVSMLVKELKRCCTLWIREQDDFASEGFAWQAGYGAFSVSESILPTVRDYILRQEERHRQWTFQDEFLLLLKKHGLVWDEKYIWK